MIEGRSSRTAQYMALFRALEDARPRGRRLFEDPVAASFLEPSLLRVARAGRLPLLRTGVPWFIDTRWPGARTSAVARTRFIDDVVIDGDVDVRSTARISERHPRAVERCLRGVRVTAER